MSNMSKEQTKYMNQIEEILQEFRDFGFKPEVKNDYIHIPETQGVVYNEVGGEPTYIFERLIKRLNLNQDTLLHTNIVSIRTGNDYDPVKTNLIVKLRGTIDEQDTPLTRLNEWFNSSNNFTNSFISIQRKLEERGLLKNNKFSIPFRPTQVLNFFREMFNKAGDKDKFIGFKPLENGSRSLVYDFYGNELGIVYKHKKEHETLEISMGGRVYYSENFIAYDQEGLFHTVENLYKIYMKLTRKFKRSNSIEKLFLFMVKIKESKKSVL